MIGIIPAAGKAERMNGLPKMLLPVPGQTTLIKLMTERMLLTPSIKRVAVWATRRTKVIINEHVGAASVYQIEQTRTMSETVLCAHKTTTLWGNDPILFGMPDTYFEDANAFVKLAAELDAGADVAVGVFYTRPEQRHKLGMVEIAGDEVLHVVDKPAETDLIWAWGVLAWKPRFWQYIDAADPHVGYALPRALAAELDVRAVRMSGGFWDCGTPEEYFQLIAHLQNERVSL